MFSPFTTLFGGRKGKNFHVYRFLCYLASSWMLDGDRTIGCDQTTLVAPKSSCSSLLLMISPPPFMETSHFLFSMSLKPSPPFQVGMSTSFQLTRQWCPQHFSSSIYWEAHWWALIFLTISFNTLKMTKKCDGRVLSVLSYSHDRGTSPSMMLRGGWFYQSLGSSTMTWLPCWRGGDGRPRQVIDHHMLLLNKEITLVASV